MTGLFNPDSGWEAALLAFISLCGLLTVVLPVVITQRRQGRQLGEIRDHVSNDHDTNLRDDIDDLMAAVKRAIDGVSDLKADVRDVKQDIGGLREELRTERIERIEGDKLRVIYSSGG